MPFPGGAALGEFFQDTALVGLGVLLLFAGLKVFQADAPRILRWGAILLLTVLGNVTLGTLARGSRFAATLWWLAITTGDAVIEYIVLVWLGVLAIIGLVHLYRNQWPRLAMWAAILILSFIVYFYLSPIAQEYRIAKTEQMNMYTDRMNKCLREPPLSRHFSDSCLAAQEAAEMKPLNVAFAKINRNAWRQLSDFFSISWSTAFLLSLGLFLFFIAYCVLAPTGIEITSRRNQALRDRFTQHLMEKADALGLPTLAKER